MNTASIVNMPETVLRRVSLHSLLSVESRLLASIGLNWTESADKALDRIQGQIAYLAIKRHSLKTVQLAYVA